ncbi:hypothetical protein GCM10022631_24870 [Deinococcus rubellus]|uniref:diguanylate cyclase n=1 Tax=Deinococcus rubellus TaxID=1889240 RepID=UPI0031EB7A63
MRASRQVLEQPLDAAELARATLCLGCGLMHRGEFNAAEPELQRALHLYGGLSDEEGRRLSLHALGSAKGRQGRPVEALALFLQVRHMSVTLGHVQGEIEALNSIGASYGVMGDHANALEHQLLALGLSRKHGLPSVERTALNNMSMTYFQMRRYGDALEAALACLTVLPQDEPASDVLAIQTAGQAYFGLKQFAQARAMYLRASELIEHAGDQAGFASLQLFLGQVAQQQGAFAEAHQLFQRSLEICQKIGHEYGQVESLSQLSGLLGASGQVEQALDALHRARSLAETSQLRSHLCEIDLALSKLYRQAGRPHEALSHLEQHLQLNGELFSATSDQRIQSLRVQSGLEQAERERLAAQNRNVELSALNARLGELNDRLEETNRDLQAAQSQTAELLVQLEQHANEDALTGLLNRRAFDVALADLLPNQQISIVVCDIDHFKSVNDRFSHLVGDQVLRQVGALLKSQLRRGDLLARYGGEEFMLLLTEASQTDTLKVCEHLRRTIENHDWSTVHPELSLTVSLGAAVARLEPTSVLQDVMRVADDALYAAKHAGRNRVEVRQVAPLG